MNKSLWIIIECEILISNIKNSKVMILCLVTLKIYFLTNYKPWQQQRLSTKAILRRTLYSIAGFDLLLLHLNLWHFLEAFYDKECVKKVSFPGNTFFIQCNLCQTLTHFYLTAPSIVNFRLVQQVRLLKGVDPIRN